MHIICRLIWSAVVLTALMVAPFKTFSQDLREPEPGQTWNSLDLRSKSYFVYGVISGLSAYQTVVLSMRDQVVKTFPASAPEVVKTKEFFGGTLAIVGGTKNTPPTFEELFNWLCVYYALPKNSKMTFPMAVSHFLASR